MTRTPRRMLAWLVGCAALGMVPASITAPRAPPAPSSDTLRVASANLLFDNAKPAEATEAVLALDADLLVLTEWTGRNVPLSALESAGYHPLVAAPRDGVRGLAVLARRPFGGTAAVIESPVDGPCALPLGLARLDTPAGPLATVAVHAPPPVTGCADTTQPTLETLAGWISEGRLTADLGPASAGQPTLMLGDFNSFSLQRGMRALEQRGLVDAASAAHLIPAPTWPTLPLGISVARIDYVLAPVGWDVVDSGTVSVPGSDHRAVWADLRLPPPQQS